MKRLSLLSVFLVAIAIPAYAATYTVNTTSDANTGAGTVGSLRWVIGEANANPGPDIVAFNIPGAPPYTIQIATPLPDITEQLTIEGYTQPGASANTLSTGTDASVVIVLQPTVGSTATRGLSFTAAATGSTVKGLAVGGFSNAGIFLNGTDNVTIVGNYIGVNSAGTTDAGNGTSGIFALNGASGLVIGTPAPADRNVISANNGSGILLGDSGTTGSIRNNYIGTSASGNAAIGNIVGIQLISVTDIQIGGTAAGEGNVISGNNSEAISIASFTTFASVLGNLIGTNALGTAAIPNGTGITVYGSSGGAPGNVVIGGDVSGSNTIAFNTGVGIALSASVPPATGVQILGNSIHSNGSVGIDLAGGAVTPNDDDDGDSGANFLQNFPVITSATFSGGNITVNGTLNSTANRSFTLRFFQSPSCDNSGFGEGQLYLGNAAVTTDALGDGSFSATFAASAGGVITATATDTTTNSTSEFSGCSTVVTAVTPEITIDDPTVVEGDAGTTTLAFTVTLSATSASAVTVAYATSNGTAIAGSDYVATSNTLTIPAGATTGTINVTVNGDTDIELDETILLDLANPVNATIADVQGSGTIQNDDALPVATIADVTQVEGSGGGTTLFVFTITFDKPAPQPGSFDYASADGTAQAGSDFTATSVTANFGAGATTIDLAVPVAADVMNEVNETFFVNLSAPSNVSLGDDQAVGTIQNDDAVPTITIDDPSITEGDSGSVNLNFTATLSNPSQPIVTVFFNTSDGTATQPADYLPNSGSFSFPAGSTTTQVTVSVNGDTAIEPDETFFVNLTSATNGTLNDSQATGTIVNDDGVVIPSITISDPSVTEGNAGTTTLSFVVTLSSASASPVTVNYQTADGTATAGSDYVATSGTLTIPSGSTTGTIDVSVNGDVTIEANETLFVNLSAPGNATISDAQGTGTIANDDGLATPGVSIADLSLSEGNSGTTLFNFTVQLSQASASDVSVTATTADGTATAGGLSDYLFQTNVVTIPSGSTSGTFVVAVNGDVVVEGDETFSVTLSNPVNVTILDGQATGTILNDDAVTTTELTITKTAAGVVAPGGNITYTIGVTNAGAATATNTVVTDVLPAGTTFVSATPTQGSCSGTTTVTCNLGSLAPAASASITLIVTAPASGTVSNTASVASPEDVTAGNNTASAVTTVAAAAADVPTLSTWMLFGLMAAMAGLALVRMR